MKKSSHTPQQVFDQWALDTRADGMERCHRASVSRAFSLIPESGGHYLEIGTGNGYGIHYMATHQYQNGQCVGLDVSPNMVRKTEKRLQGLDNVRLETADFLNWKPPGTLLFSCIFSMEVFYYFQDIRAGVERAVCLLEPEGMLLVLVNYYLENEITHSWPEDLGTPMTLWSQSQYLEAFQKSGLKKIKQERFDTGDGLGTLCTRGIKS